MTQTAVQALIENGRQRRRDAEALARLVLENPHSTPAMLAHAQGVLGIEAAREVA